MIKIIRENKVFYPNGVEVSDTSIDLSKALDFMYGTDRDKDIKSYTQDMKQRAINYWIKKTDGMLKESTNTSDGKIKFHFEVEVTDKGYNIFSDGRQITQGSSARGVKEWINNWIDNEFADLKESTNTDEEWEAGSRKESKDFIDNY